MLVKKPQQNVSAMPRVTREKDKAEELIGVKEVTQRASRALFFSVVKGDPQEVRTEEVTVFC